MLPRGDAAGAIVICNHWTQYGIGETYPEGEVQGRWYQRNFSSVFGLEQGRRWIEANPANRVCHEFDAYFLESLDAEDPDYLAAIRDLLDRGLMELPGGTFGQAESQVFGYESALRQLTFGQTAYRRYLGRGVDTFLVEEQNFFPQLPQLLKLAGFKYASIQFQNSGTPPASPHDLILWEAFDGTAIPTIPNHPGMLSCARQWLSYDNVIAQLAGRKAALIFQWMELWPPGLDWGASIMPYQEAIHEAEGHGFRQMTLTEYIQWALARCETPRVRIPMDQSNYNNNFFQGGWGYENEQTARGANKCESLLLALETLCAGGRAQRIAKRAGNRLRELWARLLVSQNHDPYLAGSVPAYVDGVRSYQSELAVKQLSTVQQVIRDEAGLGEPLTGDGGQFRLFNPCPWDVAAPILLELDSLAWPSHAFKLTEGRTSKLLSAAFRSDDGHALLGPLLARIPSYGTLDLQLEPATDAPLRPNRDPARLMAKQEGRVWDVGRAGGAPRRRHEAFAGIEFEPLVGEWHQIPSYFTALSPNMNIEAAHTRIEDAPVNLLWHTVSDGIDTAAWRRDLMRIRDVDEPALSVQGLVSAGEEPRPLVQFNHRLTSTIRFETGARPLGTWRFRVHVRGSRPRIVADAPFSEEERRTDQFYCARYIRLEWPGRHLLWCPSQNTLFRCVEEANGHVIECTVLDFSFIGTANWEMRFHAGSSFSAAESMRLAETFHRRPVRIPSGATAGRVGGVSVDNPNVLITHVFPGGPGAAAIRTLNASHEPQTATIRWPGRVKQLNAADLHGNSLGTACEHSTGPCGHWRYTFHPWEIATFRVAWQRQTRNGS